LVAYPSSPFRITRTAADPLEWSHRIAIDEMFAILEPDRVVRFAELLDREPLITKALHERLDLVLIRAPTVDALLLEDLAERAWATAARQSR
jgi:hypothetical protein